MFVGLPLGVLPSWLPKPATADSSYIDDWAKWNYSGYERKEAYPEYKKVVDMMGQVGQTNGCGRTHWEYESGQDRFGTPMALMLLPFWTDGCIGSMEGLYFESSASVPYHFLTAAELSKAPSNPQRDLPYTSLDVEAGVRHLQMMGTRYYLVFSPEATAQAEQKPDLDLVSVADNWRVYQVKDSEIVAPLAFQPAVLSGGGKGEQGWLDVSAQWYMDPESHDVPLAQSGPKEWQRVGGPRGAHRLQGVRQPTSPSTSRSASRSSRSQVSNIKTTDNRISFDVDKVGSPVLVKASYFPNWKAWGAEGPVAGDAEPHGGHPELDPRHHQVRLDHARRHRLADDARRASAWPSSGPGGAASCSIPPARRSADPDRAGSRDEDAPRTVTAIDPVPHWVAQEPLPVADRGG